MKRFLLLLLPLLLTIISLPAGAQPSIDSGNPSIDLSVKRCFASGNTAYLDLVFTAKIDIKAIVIKNQGGNYATSFYDDEGKRYGGYGKVLFEIDDRQDPYHGYLEIARDIPRKVRVVVPNLDKYATEFPLITMSYSTEKTSGASYYTLTIKNMPIDRE